MSDQQARSLTDIEKEAGNSYREWPVYIVMRLKRLQAIQEKLRVHGDSPSSMIRREELLKAVYDQDTLEPATVEDQTMSEEVEEAADEYEAAAMDSAPEAPAPKAASKAKSAGGKATAKAKPKAAAASADDSDYLDDVNYD